ncbi:MAG: hypothetical protein Q7T11_07015 [Deltaproteobacteria bacterium]|nr:hypothetical protein [Deltaproteobacteria bacterium]
MGHSGGSHGIPCDATGLQAERVASGRRWQKGAAKRVTRRQFGGARVLL